ncbi:unnamed protein product [Prunus armeniaca]
MVAFKFVYAHMTLPHEYRGFPNRVVQGFAFSGLVYLPEFLHYMSPEFCEDCVLGKPCIPRVLQGCITHVATCVV